MRKVYLLILTICLLLFGQAMIAQEYYGAEASARIDGASIVRYSERSDVPSYIKFKPENRIPLSYLETFLKKQFHISEKINLKQINTEKGRNEKVIRYKQFFSGAELHDAQINVLVEAEQVKSISGFMYDDIVLLNQPIISKENALELALHEVPAEVYKWELEGEETMLKEFFNDQEASYYPKAELILFPAEYPKFDGRYKYAYSFTIYADKPLAKKKVYIDTESGKTLASMDQLHMADVTGTANTKYSGVQEIVADSYNGSFRLRETGRGNGIETYDMNTGTNYNAAVDFTDTDNYWNNFNTDFDEVAADAHWASEMTYDYYYDNFNRNSIDNNGLKLQSFVHYDVSYANAFWDGTRMTYGDGDGSITPLTALDIVAHEITHGLTSYTANLDYSYESGAINEGFSDIFGTSIEYFAKPTQANWNIGEDIGYIIRSMANPNQYSQPDTYHGNNWYFGSDDNGGVHYNNGVMNYWYYLVCEGGNGTNDLGNTYNFSGIGVSDGGKIAYRTLVNYLTNTSQYVDARFYSIMAAIDLFGACSNEVEAVTRAWYAVGIGPDYVNYVMSDFSSDFQQFCSVPAVVNFQNQSVNGTSYQWNFGDNSTSTDLNPTHIFNNYGNYTITLMTDGGTCGADTLIDTAYISIDPANPCIEMLSAASSTNTQTNCFGTLFDNGGTGNYQDNTDFSITIQPAGALSVTLTFASFNFEQGYDYLYVYDGPSNSSNLIGQYDGTNLPNGGTITSTGSAITIRQSTDGGVTAPGFELSWSCDYAMMPPMADFSVNQDETCSGDVFFTDLSSNGATTWTWDFGDGNTSTLQHPSHAYSLPGVYNVSLISTNAYGTDTIVKTNFITVLSTEVPLADFAENCAPTSFDLHASGNGLKLWYNDSMGNELIHIGDTLSTVNLTQSEDYYVQSYALNEFDQGGKTDNSGGGGYFSNAYVHYLAFDCYAPFKLVSVKVYANSNANRTISLNDQYGNLLQEKTVYIPGGESRVYLNFDVQPGVGYQLQGPESSDLYRNNNVVNEYPFTIDGVLSITNSSASTAPTGYYYYFYDWEIMQESCMSPMVQVMALIQDQIIADFAYSTTYQTVSFNNLSEQGTSYAWDFGDGATSTDPNPVHQYNQDGTYPVQLISTNACGSDTIEKSVIINTTGIDNSDNQDGLSIFPNPNSGSFYVRFSINDELKNALLEVFNIVGKKVYMKQVISSSNNALEEVDLGDIAKGVYQIRLSNDEYNWTQKIVIQ